MEKHRNKVGSVVSISGNNVIVQLFESGKSNSFVIDGMVYRIGQIGSFMKIPLGHTILFGIVTNAGIAAASVQDGGDEHFKDNFSAGEAQQWLSVSLIGEQTGSRFDRGISQSPTTGDAVHIVTLSDLVNIYAGQNEESSLNIGNISISTSLNAYLDMNKLISRHFAILGSTGSGKSNAVGVILNSIIAKKFPRTRILMLDPHGEYSSVFGDAATVFKVNSTIEKERLYIPYWALSFNEFVNLFDEEMSDQNKETLREKLVEVKIRSAAANGILMDPQMITADSPIPFNLQHLWFDTPSMAGSAAGAGSSYLTSGKKNIHAFLSNIGLKLKDPRYDFLLKPGEYNPDFWGKVSKSLTELLVSWVGGKTPITILDISDIPSEIMMPMSGTLLNIMYEALFWGQETPVGGREQPLLIVLEEAHNYLRAGEKSIASRTVQRIAKEGRKYGISLLLVTQRPTELDETVLSQCGTIIALRMNNSKDISYVAAAVQDELKAIVDMLPGLRIGEGIVSGESVSIPSRVQFYKLPRAPKSADPNVSEKWSHQYKSKTDDYNKLVTLWMNKRFDIASIDSYEPAAPVIDPLTQQSSQGYPPQGQGFPQQGQGFPPQPQAQGFPQQQQPQGFPPPPPGFPQQGQGFPPMEEQKKKQGHLQYQEFLEQDGYY